MKQGISIQSIINEAVEQNNSYKSSFRKQGKFHVSDAGKCYRQRFLKRLGVESTRTIPTPNLRKMLAGDAGHEKLQSLLSRYKKISMSEERVESENFVGHTDGIVRHNGTKAVVDFKTIEKWAMGWIKKQGAKDEHKLQLFTYWSMLRDDIKGLDQATLVYVKREDFETVEYSYTWSQDIADQVKHEWDSLMYYWDKRELPPCTCKEMYGGKGPAYCNYGTSETQCCSASLYKEDLWK